MAHTIRYPHFDGTVPPENQERFSTAGVIVCQQPVYPPMGYQPLLPQYTASNPPSFPQYPVFNLSPPPMGYQPSFPQYPVFNPMPVYQQPVSPMGYQPSLPQYTVFNPMPVYQQPVSPMGYQHNYVSVFSSTDFFPTMFFSKIVHSTLKKLNDKRSLTLVSSDLQIQKDIACIEKWGTELQPFNLVLAALRLLCGFETMLPEVISSYRFNVSAAYGFLIREALLNKWLGNELLPKNRKQDLPEVALAESAIGHLIEYLDHEEACVSWLLKQAESTLAQSGKDSQTHGIDLASSIILCSLPLLKYVFSCSKARQAPCASVRKLMDVFIKFFRASEKDSIPQYIMINIFQIQKRLGLFEIALNQREFSSQMQIQQLIPFLELRNLLEKMMDRELKLIAALPKCLDCDNSIYHEKTKYSLQILMKHEFVLITHIIEYMECIQHPQLTRKEFNPTQDLLFQLFDRICEPPKKTDQNEWEFFSYPYRKINTIEQVQAGIQAAIKYYLQKKCPDEDITNEMVNKYIDKSTPYQLVI